MSNKFFHEGMTLPSLRLKIKVKESQSVGVRLRFDIRVLLKDELGWQSRWKLGLSLEDGLIGILYEEVMT